MGNFRSNQPLGTTDVKVLLGNSSHFDVVANSKEEESTLDRFGRSRKTLWGMECDFQRFLVNSGYQDMGDYAVGIELMARNQMFYKDGELYRASVALDLPYTLTGDWALEAGFFVAMGDQALRQLLADATNPEGGAEMVAYQRHALTASSRIPRVLRSQILNIQADFGMSPGDYVTDAVNRALRLEKTVRIPSGTWKFEGAISADYQDTHIVGDGFSTVLEFASDIDLCIDIAKNRMRFSNLAIKVTGASTAVSVKAAPETPLYNFDHAFENVLFVGNHAEDSLCLDLQSYINTFHNCHFINFRTLIKFGHESNRNTFLGCTLRSEHTSAGTPDEASLIVMDANAGVGNAFIGCDIEGTPNYYLTQNGGQVAFQGGYFEGARSAAGIKQATRFSGASCSLRDVFYSGGIAFPARGNSLVVDNCHVHGPFSESWPAIQNYHEHSDFGSFELKNAQNQPSLIRVAMGGHSNSYGIFDGKAGNYDIRPDKFEYIDIFTRGLVIHNRGTDQATQAFGPLRMQGPYVNGLTSEREKFLGEIQAGACGVWAITEQRQDANYSIEIRTLRNSQASNAFDVSTIHIWTGSASGGQFEATVVQAVAGNLVQVSAEVIDGFVTLKVCNISDTPFSFYSYASVRGCVALY